MAAPALVSIVIATWRSRRDHLREAIQSALQQDWPALEVLVSDDSPDSTLQDFVAGFGDRRLRYRRNPQPLGAAGNHWAAFADARGQLIAVLNHDDLLAPGFVTRLASALQQQPQAVLAFCDHWIIDVAGQRQAAATQRNSQAWGRAGLAPGLHRPFAALVVAQTLPMAMGALFRRAALPAQLPADAGPAYDLWLGYLLCRGGGGAWYEAERLSAWRCHDGNLSSQGGLAWMLGAAGCWQAMAHDPLFSAHHAAARRQAALAFGSSAQRAWAAGQRGECARLAWRSLASRPSLRGLACALLPLLPAALAPQRWGGRRGGSMQRAQA